MDNTASVTTSNDGSDTAGDATFVDCPAIAVEKNGPATVYHGDQATYTFKVTNPGNVPLTAITVSDDKCAPVTGPTAKTGGNQDAALDPGETWTYTCTKTIAPHQAGEANPIVNTVTATGTDRPRRRALGEGLARDADPAPGDRHREDRAGDRHGGRRPGLHADDHQPGRRARSRRRTSS